jgi:hypothetical protein
MPRDERVAAATLLQGNATFLVQAGMDQLRATAAHIAIAVDQQSKFI